MSPEMKSNLDMICAGIDKKYGKGSIQRLTDKATVEIDNVTATGSIGLDVALGIGGYKDGRIVEIYGPESCIAGESFLPYEVWNKEERINHKGGTIRRLHERFTGNITEDEPKQGRHLQDNNCDFYVKSVDSEGKIIRNKVLDVVKTGTKKCFKLDLNTGEAIFATAEHKFMTPDGFCPLSKLSEGDVLFVHNNTRVKGRKNYLNRPEIMVKYHPCLPIKKVKDGKTEKIYIYHRGQKSRLAYEAHLNNMNLSSFVNFLNEKTQLEISSLNFIPEGMHVHHIDENFHNNEISNLQLISPKEHGSLHSKDRLKNLSFVVVPSVVARITEVDEMETYDLKCAYPYNNYIAEGIVVHNSGKTTLCLHAVVNAQKRGKVCVYVDAEHSLDMLYAQNLGINLDTLLVTQPDCGEQALDIVDTFVRSGEVGLIIIDSVAALVPQKELEGEIGIQVVGLQARMMSQAMRKFAGVCNQTGCSVIFVNQIRMKIGVMYGSPETTTGGNALKYYASQRLDIRRIGDVKVKDVIVGNKTKVKVIKNKLAPPKRQVEFNIVYGKGIDTSQELLDLAISDGLIIQKGAWFRTADDVQIAQGSANAVIWLEENPLIKAEMLKQVKENRGML